MDNRHMGGNYTVSMHITAVMLNSAFICSAQLLKNSAPLSMFDMSILLLPFSVQLFAVSCNGCHWRLKSPNYPFMGFYDIDLALCSMCNMYRNTVHLCIYCQKNVQHVAHKTGTIWVFFYDFAIFLQELLCWSWTKHIWSETTNIHIKKLFSGSVWKVYASEHQLCTYNFNRNYSTGSACNISFKKNHKWELYD